MSNRKTRDEMIAEIESQQKSRLVSVLETIESRTGYYIELKPDFPACLQNAKGQKLSATLYPRGLSSVYEQAAEAAEAILLGIRIAQGY